MKRTPKAAILATMVFFLLMLTPPVGAENKSSVAGELRGITIIDADSTPGWVRKYDGRQGDGAELDLKVQSDFDKALFEIWVDGLNSADEMAGFDINVGSLIRIQGDLKTLTSRQPVSFNGIVVGDTYQTAVAAGWITLNRFDSTQDLRIKRTETNLKLGIALPQAPVRFGVGFWRETEIGSYPWLYRNGVTRVVYATPMQMDRFTREISFDVDADVGNGVIAYGFDTRKFSEKAPSTLDKTDTRTNGSLQDSVLRLIGEQRVDKHRFLFRYRVKPNLSLAVGAATRKRENLYNGYRLSVHSGHLSVAYRPSKDLSMTARLYMRANQLDENYGHMQSNEAVLAAFGSAQSIHAGLDFYTYKGDFKIRYSGFRNVKLTLGYKPEHTYRKHTERATQKFPQANYADGFISAADATNGPQAKDTIHKFLLKVLVALPGDLDLDMQFKAHKANRGAYESWMTDQYEENVTLTVPIGTRFQMLASGGHLIGKNATSSFSNYEKQSSNALVGLSWYPRGIVSFLGIDYSYFTGQESIDAFFGQSNRATRTNKIHITDAPYNYTDQTLSVSAGIGLPWKLAFEGTASITRSYSEFLTKGAFDPYFTTGETLPSINPTDVTIVGSGFSLERPLYKTLKAKLGYNTSHWNDKLDSNNNGRFHLVSFGLSGRF